MLRDGPPAGSGQEAKNDLKALVKSTTECDGTSTTTARVWINEVEQANNVVGEVF